MMLQEIVPAEPAIHGLGDARRDARGSLLLARMIDAQSARVRELAHARAEEVGFSRWLGNPHFGLAELRAGLRASTTARCAGAAHVLVLQDTSEINCQAHAGRVRGLGPVGNGRDCGLFVHALLAVAADGTRGFGALDVLPFVRTPRTDDYRRQPIEAKESYRWIEGLTLARALAGPAALVTLVGDRESDIYELFARRPADAACHVLVRACRNRRLADGQRLFDAMAALPASFGYRITVPPRRPGPPAREASLLVRWGALRLRPPQRSRRAATDELTLWAVEASEAAPPSGPAAGVAGQRICWRLLTSHAITDAAMAAQVIDWYRQRWHVEQLFRLVKAQGLDLEASQAESAAGLGKLAIMSTHAAARIQQLVLARDGGTPVPAGELFDPLERVVLAALLPQYEGRTVKQKNPHPPDTLAWCAWIIARLGGWKGYRHSEGPPGPLTMRRGYQRFLALAEGYRLATSLNDLCKP
jgi:hypothetical protein